MKSTFYFCVNGILTVPGDSEGWTIRANEWIEDRYLGYADRYEYFSGALLTRMLFQARRAREVIKRLKQRAVNHDIVLVGHSNGCEIICRVLKSQEIKCKAVHLIAAACEQDFNKNGLNKAIEDGIVDELHLYTSTSDEALDLARATSWLSFFGMGYGLLGSKGPTHINLQAILKTEIHRRDSYRHSTWFDEHHLDETMKLITGS